LTFYSVTFYADGERASDVDGGGRLTVAVAGRAIEELADHVLGLIEQPRDRSGTRSPDLEVDVG
jgi:hypothetical protein